jgi:hypothetical protein
MARASDPAGTRSVRSSLASVVSPREIHIDEVPHTKLIHDHGTWTGTDLVQAMTATSIAEHHAPSRGRLGDELQRQLFNVLEQISPNR